MGVIYRVEVTLTEKFDEGAEFKRYIWLEGSDDTETYKEEILSILAEKYESQYHIEEVTITGLAFPDSEPFYSLTEKIK